MDDIQIHWTRYSQAKHWVDDVNNCCHNPIGLEEVWQMKWRPTCQFTFICSVAEVNEVKSRARAWHHVTTLQLKFHQALANQMLNNLIHVPVIPELPPMRTRRHRNIEHVLLKRGLWQGSWNSHTRQFWEVNTEYLRLQCSNCGWLTRQYCLCDPTNPRCNACHALHVNGLK